MGKTVKITIMVVFSIAFWFVQQLCYPYIIGTVRDSLFQFLLLCFISLLYIIVITKLRTFLNKEYQMYLSFGLSPISILFIWLKRLLPMLYFIIPAYSLFIIQEDVFRAALSLLFSLLLILMFSIGYYVVAYNKKLFYLLNFIIFILINVAVVRALSEVIFTFKTETEKGSFLIRIMSLPEWNFCASCLSNPSIVVFVIVIIIVSIFLCSLLFMDDYIIDTKDIHFRLLKRNTSKHHNNILVKWSALQTVIMAGKRKSNLIFLLVYVFYPIGVIWCQGFESIFYVFSMFSYVWIFIGIDGFYRGDITIIPLFHMFGITYSNFIKKRLMSCIIPFSPIFIIQFIHCFVYPNLLLQQCLLLMYFLVGLIYWNYFYMLRFHFMRYDATTVELLCTGIALIGYLVPGINILLCIWYRKRGKKIWDETYLEAAYVNN